MNETKTKKFYRALAVVIVEKLNAHKDFEAQRLLDEALLKGADFVKLDNAIFEERYGEGV